MIPTINNKKTISGNVVRVIPAIAIPLPLEERFAQIPKMNPTRFRTKAKKRLIAVPGEVV